MSAAIDHVAVVGAGVAGLAAGWTLARAGVRVSVLERTARAGGLVESERPAPGVLIEHGADGLLLGKPGGLPVVRALGLEDRLVRTGRAPRRALVLTGDGLVQMPQGLFAFQRRALPAMLRTPLLSPAAKLRLLLEPLAPRGCGDETVAAFFDRRFGRAVRERLVTPMLRGLYGVPPDAIAMRAVFPTLAEYEDRYRSLALALLVAPRATADQALVSLDGGMAALPDALASVLGDRVHRGVEVRGVERARRGLRLRLGDGDAFEVDAVVLATPVRTAAALLEGVDVAACEALAGTAATDADVVTLGFPRAGVGHALDATGFLVGVPGRHTLACTFASEKWHGRAPDGHVVLRAVLSGCNAGDRELVDVAIGELGDVLGLARSPEWWRVRRHRAALPVLGPGRLDAIRAAADRLGADTPVALAGNYLGGVGVPDAIASGLAAADRLLAMAAPGPRRAVARAARSGDAEREVAVRQRRVHARS
jgi:oxygen-dependent protoporphyrinogen oxidase